MTAGCTTLSWRGGRAVQCTGLENRRAQALVGSNPTPSVYRAWYGDQTYESPVTVPHPFFIRKA